MFRLHTRIFLAAAIAATSLATAACTDTTIAHIAAIGDPGRVTCYSGGKLVLDDFSTGKIKNAGQSDGYEFKSATTQRLQQASGDCQVDYGAKIMPGWKPTLPGLLVDARLQ